MGYTAPSQLRVAGSSGSGAFSSFPGIFTTTESESSSRFSTSFDVDVGTPYQLTGSVSVAGWLTAGALARIRLRTAGGALIAEMSAETDFSCQDPSCTTVGPFPLDQSGAPAPTCSRPRRPAKRYHSSTRATSSPRSRRQRTTRSSCRRAGRPVARPRGAGSVGALARTHGRGDAASVLATFRCRDLLCSAPGAIRTHDLRVSGLKEQTRAGLRRQTAHTDQQRREAEPKVVPIR